MAIYKRCDFCRARLKPGEACACRKKADPVKKETYAGYGTGAWKGKRLAILEKYCWLDLYEFAVNGTITAADMVHHIVPAKEDPSLFLSDENLIPLSNKSHGIVEHAYDSSPAQKAEMQKFLRAAIAKWEGVSQNVFAGDPYTAGPAFLAQNCK